MSVGILLVDPQVDFFPGGALAVTGGDEIIAPIQTLLRKHAKARLYASRDWHPPDTVHFAARGGTWPPHCVAGTPGAAFHEALDLARARVFDKGIDPGDDGGYSAFEGRAFEGRAPESAVGGVSLADALVADGVDALLVAGLATDYCVKATVLDACRAGITPFLFLPGVRPVELEPGDGARAIDEMKEAGALLVSAA